MERGKYCSICKELLSVCCDRGRQVISYERPSAVWKSYKKEDGWRWLYRSMTKHDVALLQTDNILAVFSCCLHAVHGFCWLAKVTSRTCDRTFAPKCFNDDCQAFVSSLKEMLIISSTIALTHDGAVNKLVVQAFIKYRK